jgi:hypothetical protein
MPSTPGAWRARLPFIAAAAIFVLALVVYLLTLMPTVGPVDSGELILAAAEPGVAHPPGFPIYVLIGHLFSRLPLGSVAQRLNVMSAVFAALAVAGLFAVVWMAANPHSRLPGVHRFEHLAPSTQRGKVPATHEAKKAKRREARAAARAPRSLTHALGAKLQAADLPPALALIPAGVAALAWAFARGFWSYATVAEVYSLHLALLIGALIFLLRWRNANQRTRTMEREATNLYSAAFLYGLSLSNHHVTSLLLAPAFLLLVLMTAGERVFKSRVTAVAIAALVIGLLPYLYLPIRAAQNPVLNWDNPQTLTRFWWHVTAKWQIGQIQTNLLTDPRALLRSLSENALQPALVEFTPLGIVVAAVGVWSLWQRDRRLLAFIVAAIVVSVGYGTIYGVTEPAAYFLTTFMFTAWLIGEGARGLLALAGEQPARQAAAAFVACAVPILAFGFNYRISDRSREWLVYDYAKNTLAGMAENGVLFSPDWEVQFAPLLYLHHVEGERPDVLLIDSQLLRRSWYYEHLEAQAPALMAAARTEVDAFRTQLDLFEHGLPYDPNRIQAAFEAMINALVAHALAQGRPVYLAQEVDSAISPAANQNVVAPGLQRVPQGLSFRLYADQEAHAEPAPDLNLRGLDDEASARPEFLANVRRRYTAMFANRGVYLARHNRHEEAVAAFQQTILVDPTFETAYLEAGKSLEALGRQAEADAYYAQARALAARQSAELGP